MSFSRIAALAALAVAILAVALFMFSGAGGGYQVHAIFQNAGQLVSGNHVMVGGKPIGKIAGISVTEDNLVDMTMEIEDESFVPLPQGTTATQRRYSLSSVASHYISLNPGPDTASDIADGGVIEPDKTVSVVDLDQVFDTFDSKTRNNLKRLIQQLAVAYSGRGEEASETYKYINPAISSVAELTDQVTSDQQAFEKFITDSSQLTTALAERQGEIESLVGNASATAEAIGRENRALADALGQLPGTLKQANTTLANLRTTLTDLEPLVDEMQPASKALAPFLKDLKPVVADAAPVIEDLSKVIDRSGKDNDLTDILEDGPQLGSRSKATFEHTIAALKGAQPIFSFARPYAVDLTATIAKLNGAGAMYDANGHYLRVSPALLNFTLAGGSLNQVPATEHDLSGLETGKVKRCPGGAAQPATDSSNPFLDSASFDCDPSTILPGP